MLSEIEELIDGIVATVQDVQGLLEDDATHVENIPLMRNLHANLSVLEAFIDRETDMSKWAATTYGRISLTTFFNIQLH